MQMYTSPSTSTTHVIPDTGSNSNYGSPYLYNSNLPKSSRLIEQEHHLLEDRTNSLLNTPLPLPVEFYSEAKHVMYAWAKSRALQKKYPGQPAKCALTIETLLKRMIEDQRSFPRVELRNQISSPVTFRNEELDTETEIGVNVNMYNALILAWAESGIGDAAFERCQQILESMHDLASSNSGSYNMKPNLNTVRNTLYAAASADSYAGLKAEYVLEYVTQQELILPNAACWDIVLYAWSKSAKSNPGSAQRAQEVLDWMIKESSPKEGYFSLHSTVSTDDTNIVNRKLQPTLQSYRNVVRAWVKSDDPDAAAKAERVAWQQYHQFPNLWDIHTWLAVIKAYARRGNATKAHEILNACRKHASNEAEIPNVCYALVLNTYSNSPDRSVETAVAAEDLLTEMMELDKKTNGVIRPNTFCFNIVMHAWSRTKSKGAAKRAHRIFNRMQRLHLKQMKEEQPELAEMGLLHSAKEENGVRYPYRPNSISYHILIKAWSWTRGLRATLKAEKYLDEMEYIYFSENPEHMKPNVRTYTLGTSC